MRKVGGMVGGICDPTFCILRICDPFFLVFKQDTLTAGYTTGLKLASLTVGSKEYKNWD